MSDLDEHTDAGRVVKPISDRPESASTGTISKHNTLYFEDGNIVLLSLPEDNVITAFKFYKRLLKMHSPVFKDMFSMPSSQQREKFDNVPYIHVQDKAAQLTHFLNAIYDFRGVPSKRDFYFSLDKVESIFALSTKYQCKNLLNYMRDTLSAMWPKNLEAWDHTLDKSPIRATELPEEYTLRSTLPEPCFAIRLARNYDVPEILPAAFHHLCCIYSPDSERKPRNESSDAIFDLQPNLMHLPNDDLICFLRRSLSIHCFMNLVHSWDGITCSSRQSITCRTVMLEVVLAHCHHMNSPYHDPILLLDPEIAVNRKITDMCHSCHGNTTVFLREKRAELWNSLPAFFGLDIPSPAGE